MLCMHVPYGFHLPLIIFVLLVMHDWVWGIETDVRGERLNELPLSRGWSYLVENKLFSKLGGYHS